MAAILSQPQCVEYYAICLFACNQPGNVPCITNYLPNINKRIKTHDQVGDFFIILYANDQGPSIIKCGMKLLIYPFPNFKVQPYLTMF